MSSFENVTDFSDLYEHMFGHKDRGDTDKMFEKMRMQEAIAKFKNEKKEPIKRRHELVTKVLDDYLVDYLKEKLRDADTEDMEKTDKVVIEVLEEIDVAYKEVDDYYNKLYKEIDEMKVKVVKKES